MQIYVRIGKRRFCWNTGHYFPALSEMTAFTILVLCSIIQFVTGSGNHTGMSAHKLLVKKLTESDHLSAIRPDDEGPPVVANVSMHVGKVNSVLPIEKEFTLTTSMEIKWYDERLKHDSTVPVTFNSLRHVELVWKPDLIIEREKKGHFQNLINDNKMVKIYPDGLVIYDVRFTVTMGCRMDLTNYPMDVHTCKITMFSFAYDSRELILMWEITPKITYKNKRIPQFQWTNVKVYQHTADFHNLQDRSTLVAKFTFVHEMDYYVLTIYIPSAFLVVVSWVTFWIRPDATPARAAVGATTILTTVSQYTGTRQTLKGVSYVTGLDVWLTFCVIMVTSAMIEFAVSNYLFTQKGETKKLYQLGGNRPQNAAKGRNVLILDNGTGSDANTGDIYVIRNRQVAEMKEVRIQGSFNQNPDEHVIVDDTRKVPKTSKERALYIDRISRIAFPLCFIMFTIVYVFVYRVFLTL